MLCKNILSLHNNTFQAVVVTDHAWPCMHAAIYYASCMHYTYKTIVYVESLHGFTAAGSSLHHSHPQM